MKRRTAKSGFTVRFTVGQHDGFPSRDHLADFTRCEPSTAEAAQELIHGIEGARIILIPHIQVGVIAEVEIAGSVPKGVARDVVPFAIHASGFLGRTITAPRLDGHEVLVRSQQRQPVLARSHKKGSVLQCIGGETKRLRVKTLADKDRCLARTSVPSPPAASRPSFSRECAAAPWRKASSSARDFQR